MFFKRLLFIILEALCLGAIFFLINNHDEFGNFLIKYPRVSILVNFVFFILSIDLFRRLVKYFYTKKNGLSVGRKDNFHYGIDNIAKVLVGFGLIVALFGFFGVDFRSLLTSLSIVAAAIAIITKEYINDFLVGIYFSFSRNFEIDDYVMIGEHKGRIQEIEMLKLKLLNDNDDLLIIPNNKVYASEIINYTKRDVNLLSIDFQMDIKSVKNVEELEKELINSLAGFQEFIDSSSYNLKIVEMKKDYMDLKFQYRLEHLDRELQRQIRKKTVREIFNYISGKSATSSETTD